MGDNILSQCFGKAADLLNLVDYSTDAVVSKTLLDKQTGTITLFSFDAGQGLSTHSAPYDASVYVLDGKVEITISGKASVVSAGQFIIMPANQPHALKAIEKFKMLLIMIRDKK
jgi:quercetin dioxygenase-like cupin family protein